MKTSKYQAKVKLILRIKPLKVNAQLCDPQLGANVHIKMFGVCFNHN